MKPDSALLLALTAAALGISVLAVAVAAARTYLHGQVARRSRHGILRLARTGSLMVSTLEIGALMQELVRVMDETYPNCAVAILLVDDSSAELRVGALGRHHAPDHLQRRFRIGAEGVTGLAAAQRRTMVVPDIRREPNYVQGLASGGSEVAVPLVFHDRLLGVLDLESPRRSAFSAEDVAAAEALANQVAAALERARLYALLRSALEQLSSADGAANASARTAGASEVAAHVAHVLNDPLAAVLGHVQILLRQVRDPEERRSLELIRDQTLLASERIQETVLGITTHDGRQGAQIRLQGLGMHLAATDVADEAAAERAAAQETARSLLQEADPPTPG